MIGVWLVALATPARAERPITLGEVLQTAAANNGTLVTSGFALQQAEGAVLASRGVFDPFYQIEVSYSFARTSAGAVAGSPYDVTSRNWGVVQSLYGTTGTGTTYEVILGIDEDRPGSAPGTGLTFDYYTSGLYGSVTQQLLRGIRFKYNVQNVTLAEAARTSAELEVQKQRQEALFLAAQAYWGWVYQHELHAIALEAVGVAEEALRVGRLQVERGQLAPVEATRLEAALVQAQQDALDADNLAEQAANTLLTTIGEDPSQEVLPATLPGDVPAIELDPARAVEVALAQNFDLALLRQDLDTSGIELANAKHATLPALSATVAAGVRGQRCPIGTDDELCPIGNTLDAVGGMAAADALPQVGASALFVVPLGNRASRGARATAEGTVYQRQREVEDLERTVAALVEEQVRALQSARQKMDLADANLRLAEETLTAEEALAAAGRTIQKNVLEARTEVSRTRAETSKARTDYRLAQALLLKLQGQLTAEAP